MKIIDLDSWQDFGAAVESIREEYGTYRFGDSDVENTILFRGQQNSEWELQTTLERISTREWSVSGYMMVAHACAPELESLLGESWNLPEFDDLLTKWRENYNARRVEIPHYDYWTYLRHRGFPSPLLDWSKSPYIASYFAFETKQRADRVAVFVFVDRTTSAKSGRLGAPKIQVMGPYVKTDTRHFAQQSWYTLASKAETEDYELFMVEDHKIVPHGTVTNIESEKQDLLIKITIPSSDRLAALKHLHENNITRFSMFGGADALVRTLAFQEIEAHAL